MKARPASFRDFETVVFLGARMYQESQYAQMSSFSCTRITEMFNTVMLHPQTYCLFIAETDGGLPVGFIAGSVAKHFFTDDMYANDLSVFVLPEYRGTTAGLRLIRAYEHWAIDQGAKFISLGITTGVNPEQTGEIYQKLGYRHFGTQYMRKV